MPFRHIPKCSLGFTPTPVGELSRMAKALGGPSLFIKRDDQTGLACGGNKTRKLEYLMADAMRNGADCVVTAGAIQSNHCRQTAAAAARLGLGCHLVLGGEEPPTAKGNLLLDQLLGAEVHFCGEDRKGEQIPRILKDLTEAGKVPYVIPYGGSNEFGAVAFVDALHELHAQIVEEGWSVKHIVFASSSGGTHAGLMLANAMLGHPYRITGISIDKDEVCGLPLAQVVLALANSTAEVLDEPHRFAASDVTLLDEYVGAGYAEVGDLEREAIQLAGQTEGILVDPVYTGRALGALMDLVRSGRIGADEGTLFWHTGGTPAIFAYDAALQP